MQLRTLFLSTLLTAAWANTRLDFENNNYYVIEHRPSGGASLATCAQHLGVELVRQVGELDNHWLVRTQKPSLEARVATDHVIQRFSELKRLARDPLSSSKRMLGHTAARDVVSSVKMLERQELRQRAKRDSSLAVRQQGASGSPSRALASRLGIEDPIFPDQWHIVNDQFPQHMMNVTGVWEMGITGKGVISAMVDDGLDFESDDLADNFEPTGSYDFNDHVPLPKPVLWDDHHGTRCAGEIAAVKNDVCGVGLAYDSKVAGIRILSGPISDVDEASALNYGYQNTSIYSCSWGPPDDGRSMEGPSLLIQKAVLNGINKGRGGKGSVFVFASGNGAASEDQCNFDGYTNSIYSVTVAAVDYKGLHPYYSEPCAANMVVTYSSGSGDHIHTTDVGKNACATNHGGTSAAAPLAVGVFALALSVRSDLTWRDIQYLCVQNGVQINPDDPDWDKTFIGRPYSYKYGYGVLDTYRYVQAAKNWKLVKPQAWAHTNVIELANAAMNETTGEMSGGEPLSKMGVKSTMKITKDFLKKNNLARVEHINVRVWITHSRRGDVEVELVSPKGIKSVLAAPRKFDTASTGFPGWTFMSVKHWGEDGEGDWTIRVSDQGMEGRSGNFLGWNLMLWGEAIDASKTQLYELPDKEAPLPPQSNQPSLTSVVPTTTKTLSKPTNHLPGDHGTAEGEANKPAFDSASNNSTSQSPPDSALEDEGYFQGITDLLSSNTWLYIALAVAVFFALGSGFLIWRRIKRKSAVYSALPGDGGTMGMTNLERGTLSGGRSKELYAAFGGSDDEDDDEETGLVRRRELGYNEEFLKDDDETEQPYRDHPAGHTSKTGTSHQEREESVGSGSGDGSWVVAR